MTMDRQLHAFALIGHIALAGCSIAAPDSLRLLGNVILPFTPLKPATYGSYLPFYEALKYANLEATLEEDETILHLAGDGQTEWWERDPKDLDTDVAYSDASRRFSYLVGVSNLL